MMNKRGRLWYVWVFVASFFFLVAIAMIEPLKVPLVDSMTALSCSTTNDEFIKPVCFLLKGGVVLFIGGFIGALFKWVYFKSTEI